MHGRVLHKTDLSSASFCSFCIRALSGMSTREYESHSEVKKPNMLCVGFRNMN